jgi:hypothetical protein
LHVVQVVVEGVVVLSAERHEGLSTIRH